MDRIDKDLEKAREEERKIEEEKLRDLANRKVEESQHPEGNAETRDNWVEPNNNPSEIRFNEPMKEGLGKVREEGIKRGQEVGMVYTTNDSGALEVREEYWTETRPLEKRLRNRQSIDMPPRPGDVGSFHYHPNGHALSARDIWNIKETNSTFAGVVTDDNIYLIKRNENSINLPNNFDDFEGKFNKILTGQYKKYGLLESLKDNKIPIEETNRLICNQYGLTFYKGTIDDGVSIYKGTEEKIKEEQLAEQIKKQLEELKEQRRYS